jgi:hypothetical protein
VIYKGSSVLAIGWDAFATFWSGLAAHGIFIGLACRELGWVGHRLALPRAGLTMVCVVLAICRSGHVLGLPRTGQAMAWSLRAGPAMHKAGHWFVHTGLFCAGQGLVYSKLAID